MNETELQLNGTQHEPPAAEHYPLDDAAIAMLNEIQQQLVTLNAQRQGALVLFIRQHNLQGNWTLADNGRELRKAV